MSNESEKISKQAQNWAMILTEEDIDGDQLRAFQAWRAEDPRHEEAFQRADRVWRGIANMEHLRRYAVLPETPSLSARIKNWWQAAGTPAYAGGMAMAFMLVLAVILVPKFSGYDSYSTSLAQIERIQLEDGTHVTLGAKSKLKVWYQEDSRRVELVAGDALFEVTHNKARPFVVLTGHTETRVLGTVFAVERDPDQVSVAVKQGKVRVGAPIKGASTQLDDGGARIITLGQGVVADLDGNVGEITNVDVDSIASWTHGRISYVDVTLRTIIADANRYSRKTITLADETTAQLRVSIAFSTDDVDKMIKNLAIILDLEMKQNASGDLLLQKR